MTEYIKQSVTMVRAQRTTGTNKLCTLSLSTYDDLLHKPYRRDFYDVILKKKISGISEILSNQKIYVIDNDNSEKLYEQLVYISQKLNEGNTIFYVTLKSITTYKELATEQDVESYIDKADHNCFYEYTRKPLSNKKVKEVPKQNKKLIKKMIKDYKKK